MSNTIKKPPYKFYSKEYKWARKLTTRNYRHLVKSFLNRNKFDDIPAKKGTCGWLTW